MTSRQVGQVTWLPNLPRDESTGKKNPKTALAHLFLIENRQAGQVNWLLDLHHEESTGGTSPQITWPNLFLAESQ